MFADDPTGSADFVLRGIFNAIDERLVSARHSWGERGCFVLLVSFALLAFILLLSIFALLGLDSAGCLLLTGFLTLFVIAVGSRYKLRYGPHSRSNNQVETARRKATSGSELITRYQAGERDFRKARLRWAVLLRDDLSGVDLSEADLRGAELDGATLQEVILHDANLHGADLQRANLRGSDLSGADLRGTNLSGANLLSADLGGANLRKADLSWANLSNAIVTENQLTQARSLEGATMPDGRIYFDWYGEVEV